MRWPQEYAAQIRTVEGWMTSRVETVDIKQTVEAMLKDAGIKPKRYEEVSAEGYRCTFHYWYSSKKDQFGEPVILAEAHQIYV